MHKLFGAAARRNNRLLGSAAAWQRAGQRPFAALPQPPVGGATSRQRLATSADLDIRSLQELAIEASQGNADANSGREWLEAKRCEHDVRQRVDALRSRVEQMGLPEMLQHLGDLIKMRWLDEDLLRALEKRAIDVLEELPPSQRDVNQHSRLLSRFAHFDVRPLPGSARLVDTVLQLADEDDVRDPIAIARLSRAAAILGEPQLAEARIRTLSLSEIELLVGDKQHSNSEGEDDDRDRALTMLQQWFLAREMIEGAVPAELEGLATAAQEAMQRASERLKHKRVSALQSHITRAAKRGEESFARQAFALQPHLMDPDQITEHVLESGLSIDCAFPGYKLAIEADGPLHFFWNKPHDPNGQTAFKHRLLRWDGWLLVSVSYEDWRSLDEVAIPTAGRYRRIEEEQLIDRR